MKIRFEQYKKCYPKRLKRLFQTDINYKTYSQYIPYMERAIVGNLPIEIIKLFPKEVRGTNIKLMQEIFAKTSELLRQTYHKTKRTENFAFFDANYRYSKDVTNMAKQGEDYLNREITKLYGENFITAKLNFAGFGSFANVYQLSLLKNGKKIMHDKAIKVYHTLSDGEAQYIKSHNVYAESNFWMFLRRATGHNLAKTQFTKHYISDLHSGYCMTEFIDPEITKTTAPLKVLEMFRLSPPTDYQCNYDIMGKKYDIGGYKKKKGFLTDKVALRYAKRLFRAKGKDFDNLVKHLKELINNPKTPHRDKIEQALNLFITD